MTSNNRVTIRVWGDYACFTRPEMKVEGVSYAIMTPPAVRGVLEAIFWEPQMCYLIDQILVIKKGHFNTPPSPPDPLPETAEAGRGGEDIRLRFKNAHKPWKTPRPFAAIAVQSRAKLNYFLRCG